MQGNIWALLVWIWGPICVIGTLLGLFTDFMGLRTMLREKLRGTPGSGRGGAPGRGSQVQQGLKIAGVAAAAGAVAVEAIHHGADMLSDGFDGHSADALAGLSSLDDLPDMPDAPDHPLGHIGRIIDFLDPTS